MDPESIKCIIETKRLLENQELLMGKSSKQVANTLKELSKLHFDLDEFYEAEEYLLRAINIKTQIYGDEHKEILPLLENLCLQYRQQGGRKDDVEKLEEWQSRIRHKMNAPTKKHFVPQSNSAVFTQASTGRLTPMESMEITQSRLAVRQASCLVIEHTGERVLLRQRSLWIGRDNMNDITFPDNQSVERSHALIAFEEGNYWLMNRANAAATTLNGKEVMKKTKIVCDDVIKIGNVTIRTS